MLRNVKLLLYAICKWSGGFMLARALTRRGVRILAYHGFSLLDEKHFRPALFMDADLFRARMDYLRRHKYPVLPLGEAVRQLDTGDLPDCATVVTFDDGFYSILSEAVPVLQELDMPATIYMTTYYSVNSSPVFRLAVQYVFWKTTAKSINLSGLGVDGAGCIEFSDDKHKQDVAWRIIEFGENELDESLRQELCASLAERLDVDYAVVLKGRLLELMSASEIKQAVEAGVDMQLHTHRHRLPTVAEEVCGEIGDNRDVLRPLVDNELVHFCFPSGIYDGDHLPPLADSGILSATTCDPGLNYGDANLLLLSRFLDGNNISWIEFEAEMSGFSDMLRNVRHRVLRLVGAG